MSGERAAGVGSRWGMIVRRAVPIAIVCLVTVYLYTHVRQPMLVQVRVVRNLEQIAASGGGEMPQIAIWLENTRERWLTTLYVTQGAVRGPMPADQKLLPQWRQAVEAQGRSGVERTLVDGVAGATDNARELVRIIQVQAGDELRCCVEVDQANDFNATWPRKPEGGEYQTGQPPLRYEATLRAEPGMRASMELAGYTDMSTGTPVSAQGAEGITTASSLLDSVEVSVLSADISGR